MGRHWADKKKKTRLGADFFGQVMFTGQIHYTYRSKIISSMIFSV